MNSKRELFNIPRDFAYLNTAYFGCFSNKTTEIAVQSAKLKAQPWNITIPDFYTDAEKARTLFSRLINTSEDNIAIISSASYGFALAAKNINLSSSDTILLLSEQFPSNYYIWEEQSRITGATLSIVPRPENDDWTSAVINKIETDKSIKLISLENIHWTDGGYVDLKIISQKLKGTNIKLLIDGTQSVGALPTDVAEINPDFLVVSGYKWLLGPYNLGFCYISPEFYEHGQPLEHWWGSKVGSADVTTLTDYPQEFYHGARKFDFGHRGNFHLLPAMINALEEILDWGVKNIYNYISELNKNIIDSVSSVGIVPIEEQYRAGHYLGLRFPRKVPKDFTKYLASNNVSASVRGKYSLRVTPNVWVDEQDIDKFNNTVKSYFDK